MELFLNAEDRRLVKELNEIMGTRCRTKPYDFNDPDDFAEALAMVTGEYVDFLHCWFEIDNLIEHLDESIETFYPAEWQKLAMAEAARKDIAGAVNKLRAAQSALYRLVEKAEDQCRKIWLLALTCAPDEVLEKVCGTAFRAAPGELEQLLQFTFDFSGGDITEIWQYSVEDTARAFGQALKKELDAMRKSSPATG